MLDRLAIAHGRPRPLLQAPLQPMRPPQPARCAMIDAWRSRSGRRSFHLGRATNVRTPSASTCSGSQTKSVTGGCTAWRRGVTSAGTSGLRGEPTRAPQPDLFGVNYGQPGRVRPCRRSDGLLGSVVVRFGVMGCCTSLLYGGQMIFSSRTNDHGRLSCVITHPELPVSPLTSVDV
jgi:hypothetical protein